MNPNDWRFLTIFFTFSIVWEVSRNFYPYCNLGKDPSPQNRKIMKIVNLLMVVHGWPSNPKISNLLMVVAKSGLCRQPKHQPKHLMEKKFHIGRIECRLYYSRKHNLQLPCFLGFRTLETRIYSLY